MAAENKPHRQRDRTLCIVIAILSLEWGLAFAFIFSALLPIVLVGSLLWARDRGWPALILLVICTPVLPPFVYGMAHSRTEGAYISGMGLQRSWDAFIDPTTRLPVATGGCLTNGNEWVWQTPYRAGANFMVMILGPPAHTYDGPIPSEREAREMLQSGVSISWQEMAENTLVVSGRTIVLQQLLGPALVDACYHFDPLIDPPDHSLAPQPGQIRAVMWRERVLIIEMAQRFDPDTPSQVAVIDAETGRVFGYFRGKCWGLPLPWGDVGPRTLDMDLRPILPRP